MNNIMISRNIEIWKSLSDIRYFQYIISSSDQYKFVAIVQTSLTNYLIPVTIADDLIRSPINKPP